MAGEGPMYQSDDEKYGALLGNLLNPPPEGPEQPTSGAQPQAPASAAAQAIRAGAQAGGQSIQTPPPAQPRPAATPAPTPNAVTPSGNGPAASAPQKSWADYVRSSNDKALSSLDQAQAAATQLQGTPSAATQNAPLEQRRQALAAPLPYRDPTTGKVLTSAVDPVSGETIDPDKMYKPGLGTKLGRIFLPKRFGDQPVNAPNANYQAAEAIRQKQAGAIQQQEDRNIANEKVDSERLKDIGTEQRGVATGYQDVSKSATAQQTAEQKAEYNTEIAEVRKQLADVHQQIADQGGVPKTYEQAVIASGDPDLPQAQRDRYSAAANKIAATEVKKFQYAMKGLGLGDNDPRYQPIVDAATAQVNLLNTYRYNPRLNGNRGAFYDPAHPNTYYSPEEFTAKKNEIATKLDKDLTQKKLPPLGVRFNVKDTTPGGNQPAASAAAAPPKAATSAPTPPPGATHVYKDAKGNIAGYAVNGRYVPAGAK